MASEPEATTKKKGGKRKWFVIAGVLLLVGAGAYFGLQFFGGGEAEAGEAESEPPAEGEVLDVATLTTTVGGDASLARVGLAVVLTEGAAADPVTARFPLLKDAAVSELAASEAQELRTADGANRLRRRLTRRAQQIYPDGEVLRVLLTEMVIQ
jgi:flagellar FliL protein